jgi:HEAT repeat protein
VDGLKGVYEDEVLATVGRALKAELDDNVIGAIFDYLKDAPAEKVEDFVLQALDAQSSKTKSRAIQILALNKCEKALDRVLDTAKKTPELEVKLECIAFFAVFPDKTEAYMIKLLEDQNSQIRNKVINELAAKKSKAAYEKIHEVYRKDAEKDVRSNAFRYFLSLGAEAADVLMEGLKDDQGDIKEAAIEGLGELRLETAIEPLLEACRKDKSKPIQDRCVSALAKIGKKAIAAAEAAAKADPAMEPIATGVSQQYDDVVVETVLSKFITDKETTGWFAGQFKELSTLEIGKDRTAAVLIRMHGDNYEPRTKKLFELRRVQLLNRVATLALGELGGTKSTEFLLQKFDALLKNPEYDGLIEEIGVGLVHAGEKAVLDRLVERIQKEVDARLKEDKAGAFERQFSIGSVRNRAGDVKGALAAYQTLEKSMAADAEKDPFLYAKVHYNISCAHSLLGDKAAAVDHLRKAVESGFKDKEWIEIDKDLDAIRGEEGYKRLIADEKLFRED